MLWRFEELPGAGEQGALVYDEVRQLLRGGERDWVRVPWHSALVLSLLLRMQEHGYTVSARAIAAFLLLGAGKRVSGYVSDLRKKIEACGVDSERVLEPNQTKTGYRLAAGVRAVRLSEAEAREWIGELVARSEEGADSEGEARAEQRGLREMLVLCSVFALGLTGYLLVRPGGDAPLAQLDVEEGAVAGTLVPYRTCAVLGRELQLREQDVLAVELSRPSASGAARVVISVEREPGQDGAVGIAFELAAGARSTVRIEARRLEPGVRSHVRRICLGELGYVESALQPGAIRLQAIRVE